MKEYYWTIVLSSNILSYLGLVYVNDLIDYEKIKWINMTLFVYDSGKPEQKYSTIFFYCKIDDINDNFPIIEKIIEKNNEYSIESPNNGNATIRIKNVCANIFFFLKRF
jgi:hypothetical protein